MRKHDLRTGVLYSIVEGIAFFGSRHPLLCKDVRSWWRASGED
jgi:hypothetical protein